MRKEIKSIIAIVAMLLNGGMAFAQATDPVVMTINGKQVLRSEYEYSYNKFTLSLCTVRYILIIRITQKMLLTRNRLTSMWTYL